MAIVYAWSFPSFDVVKSEDGLTDVVKAISWEYSATAEGTTGPFGAPYSAKAYGVVQLGAPNPTDFIPYDQLTKQWAIDAVSAQVDVPTMQQNLTTQVEVMENPPVVPMAPPFSQGAA